MTNSKLRSENLKSVIRYLESQKRGLLEAKVDADFLATFELLIRHLHRMPPAQVQRLLGNIDEKSSSKKLDDLAKSAEDISLDEIESLMKAQSISRIELEAIAIGRFKVPKGSLRSIGGINNLKEAITSFIQNERAHESIKSISQTSLKFHS